MTPQTSESANQHQPTRCVVTGGAGFIGSHLTERLLQEGCRVVVIDNLASGRLENLAHLQSDPRLSFLQADAADLPSIRQAFTGANWVFHLAALADIVPSIENPLAYHHANVDGAASVLEATRHAGAQRFVYAASSSCYGLPDRFPTPEDAPIRPMYPYALTKFIGERYVLHWRQCYGLPCVSLRFFNVFGPRSRTTGAYGAVMGVFLAQKLAGKPFTIVGDGKQTRDFTFVTDVADALLKAAQSDATGQIFNVGSGGTYSINHLVSLLAGPKIHIPKRPGEPDCTFADISKIQRVLGWKPQVSFEQGVHAMMDQIHLWKDAPVWDEKSIAAATQGWFKYLGNNPDQSSQPHASSIHTNTHSAA